MATRNTASASAPRAPRARKTVVNAEVIRESATETHSADVEEAEDLFAQFRAAADKLAERMGVGMTPRRVIGWLLGSLVAAGLSFLIGSSALVLMMAAGISTYSFIWWTLALVTAVVAGIAGGKLGGFVMEYVADGHAERHISAAKSWVTGLFSSKARRATA